MKKLLLLLFILCSIFAHAQTWLAVGNPGFSAGMVSNTNIAIDTGGVPYVVFADAAFGNKATVMKFADTGWAVVGSAGFTAGAAGYTNMAIDYANTPYVAYSDSANGRRAIVMKYNGGSWVPVGSDTGFSAGEADYTSIAFDWNETPYVMYQDIVNYSFVTVMKFNGSAWVGLGIGSAPGLSAGSAVYSGIAFCNDTPYVTYSDLSCGAGATVMKFNGSGWDALGNTCFSAGQVQWPAIAFDGRGTPYVVYHDDADADKATVMKYSGGAWTLVGNAGFSGGISQYNTIAIGTDGTPYASFEDAGAGWGAAVMKYNGSAWVNAGNTGFSAGFTAGNAIAIKGGAAYLVYQDAINGYKATVMKLSIPVAVKGVQEPQTALSVFPDPSTGVFTLHISAPLCQQASIIITNTLGEKVQEFNGTTGTDIPVQINGPAGIYLVTAIMEGSVVNGKVEVW